MKHPFLLGAVIAAILPVPAWAATDTDTDGLPDADETTIHSTDPNSPDSDWDLLPDGWEVHYGLDPNDGSGDNGSSGDPDGDFVSNYDEYLNGTDPKSASSFPPCTTDLQRYGWAVNSYETDTNNVRHYDNTYYWNREWDYEELDETDTIAFTMTPASHATDLAARYPMIADPALYLSHMNTRPLSSSHTSTVWGSFAIDFPGPGREARTSEVLESRLWVRASPVAYARSFKILERRTTVTDPGGVMTYGTPVVHTLTIPASSGLSNPIDLKPNVALGGGATYSRTDVSASHVTIVPDALQLAVDGVIGEMVPSNKTTGAELHYVTPRETSEIPADYVVFNVRGVTANEITPGHAEQIVEWNGGDAVPGEPASRRVKRDVAGKTIVEVRLKGGGASVAKLNVWVVWWNITAAKVSGPTLSRFTDLSGGTWTHVQTAWDFEASVQPASILTTANDVPNLTGANVAEVPHADFPHAYDGSPLGNAYYKWDISRQWRERTLMPANLPADVNWPLTGAMRGTLPAANLIQATSPAQGADHYPLNPVEGNDDTRGLANNRDVYAALSGGKLKDADTPQDAIRDLAGTVGDLSESRSHFQEFVRAELGQPWVPGRKWYRVSDFVQWRYHRKLKKVDEAVLNQDLNGDGDKTDKLWADNGSVSDATNAGF